VYGKVGWTLYKPGVKGDFSSECPRFLFDSPLVGLGIRGSNEEEMRRNRGPIEVPKRRKTFFFSYIL